MLLKPNPPARHHHQAAVNLVLRALVIALAGSLIGGLALVAGPRAVEAQDLTLAADPFDPEVILPGRVDAALHRTLGAVDRAVAAVDDRHWSAARRSLAAAKVGFDRSHRAVVRQVLAVVDPEAEEESTGGPDSALAALNVEQVSVAALAGLFDRVRAKGVVRGIRAALTRAQRVRIGLVRVIVGLDPEEAGAAYADALADTVPAYTDEVATVREALRDDRLTKAARHALRAALGRSRAAESAMVAAFGGGERPTVGEGVHHR
ncbi:MAG TPA: hypothetical protein VNQ53_14475 [Nocardioides sp.]|nr:hypothetical protein [Nocardioides sp.]